MCSLKLEVCVQSCARRIRMGMGRPTGRSWETPAACGSLPRCPRWARTTASPTPATPKTSPTPLDLPPPSVRRWLTARALRQLLMKQSGLTACTILAKIEQISRSGMPQQCNLLLGIQSALLLCSGIQPSKAYVPPIKEFLADAEPICSFQLARRWLCSILFACRVQEHTLLPNETVYTAVFFPMNIQEDSYIVGFSTDVQNPIHLHHFVVRSSEFESLRFFDAYIIVVRT
jgi:hypothetical protein